MSQPIREEIQGSFRKYCEFMLPKFQFKFYHYVFIDHISDVIEGKRSPRLGIFMPPRHGKTLFGAYMFLTYMFGRFPHKIGVYGTYNEGFARTGRDAVERILTSKRYEWLFPGTRIKTRLAEHTKKQIKALKAVKNAAFIMHNALSPMGKLVFAGRGSTLTGIGKNYGACDDLYKNPEEALSETQNNAIFSWFMNVWMSRPEASTIEILFYTRWADNDVAGRLVEYDKEVRDKPEYKGIYLPWTFLRFPAYKDDENDNPHDIRKVGEPLNKDLEFQYIQAQIDDANFQALYQQNPIGESELYLFTKITLCRYETLPRLSYKVISIDTQFKGDSKTVDRTAITVIGVVGMDVYFHPTFFSSKMNFSELKAALIETVIAHPDYHVVLVEDSASAQPLYYDLFDTVRDIVLWDVKGVGKRERAQGVMPCFTTGRFKLPCPHKYPQVKQVDDQFKKFTGLKKNELDDIIDTIIQAIQYYNELGIFQVWGAPQVIENPMYQKKEYSNLTPKAGVVVVRV